MTDKKIDITFFIPCYNEENNVVPTCETICEGMKNRSLGFEIMVFDDASKDKSVENVKAYQKAHPESPVVLIQNEKNRGLGANYLRGASMTQGEHYMMVCGDNDTPLETVNFMVDQLGKADIIIPYLANINERPFLRRTISKTFTFLVGCFTRTHLRYYNGIVLHKTKTILENKPLTTGFAYQAEILSQAIRKGLSYIEVGIRTVPQSGPLNTSAFRFVNIQTVVASLWRLFWDKKYHRQ